MTFAELRAELFARGTDYLNEDGEGVARAERWLNQAYREILNLHPWPFLQTVAVGGVGEGFVSVPDLRKLRMVTDVSSGADRPLARATAEDLISNGTDLTETGSPEFYYVDAGVIVRAHPVGGTIKAYYTRRVAPMTASDSPIFDEEYHLIIVDRAMMKAYVDSDNFEARAALKEEYEDSVRAMAEDFLLDSREVHYVDPGEPYDG